MKTTKRILCILLTLGTYFQGIAQSADCTPCDSLQEIIVDFNTKKVIQEPCALKKDINLPIRIININRNLYNVTTNKEFKIFNIEVPDILDFAKKQQQAQQNIAVATATAQKSATPLIMTDSLRAEQKAAEALTKLLTNSKEIIDYGVCLEAILKRDIDSLEAQKQLATCTGRSSAEQLRSDLNDLVNSIQDEQDIVKANSKDPVVLQQLSSAVALIDLSKAKGDIMELYYKISNPKTFEFSTILPIKEAYRLDLEIIAAPKAGTSVERVTIPLKYPIKGLKISISPGLFVNHFPEARTYYLEPYNTSNLPPDTVLIRSTFDDNSLLPTVGALIHVSFFGGNDVDVALSAGASTRLDSGNMRWHLGTSLLLGKERRFVLSAGVTLGQGIKELDQSYLLDHPYPAAALEGRTLTQEVAHLGWFVGFSYNLPVAPKS